MPRPGWRSSSSPDLPGISARPCAAWPYWGSGLNGNQPHRLNRSPRMFHRTCCRRHLPQSPEPLPGPTHGTPRDYETALGLFGSIIVEEVDTSVRLVLDENQQMREMASEMAQAADQARKQFQ